MHINNKNQPKTGLIFDHYHDFRITPEMLDIREEVRACIKVILLENCRYARFGNSALHAPTQSAYICQIAIGLYYYSASVRASSQDRIEL